MYFKIKNILKNNRYYDNKKNFYYLAIIFLYNVVFFKKIKKNTFN